MIATGQFMVRKPEYNDWALAQFVHVGDPYSEHMRDLFYCSSYGMHEAGGCWAWGRSGEFAMQMGLASLEQYYQPITEPEAAAMAEQQLRQRQAEWNATYPAHAHGLTIREYGKLRAETFTPAQLAPSRRARLLVIDHITDATTTAAAIVVRDMATGQERITTDPAEIRALYNHATAKPCGDGSYTVEIAGGMEHLEVQR